MGAPPGCRWFVRFAPCRGRTVRVMPSPTTSTDTETREAATQARSAAARAQRDADAAEQVAAFALTDLLRAVTAGIRLFVPPVVLQPEAAIRLTATAVEQLVELQRRFVIELLSISRDAVTATDLEPMQFEVRSTGRSTAA